MFRSIIYGGCAQIKRALLRAWSL